MVVIILVICKKIVMGNLFMELKMNSVIGSLDEEIDIAKSGKDLMIGFDPKFLIDALKVIDEEEFEKLTH